MKPAALRQRQYADSDAEFSARTSDAVRVRWAKATKKEKLAVGKMLAEARQKARRANLTKTKKAA